MEYVRDFDKIEKRLHLLLQNELMDRCCVAAHHSLSASSKRKDNINVLEQWMNYRPGVNWMMVFGFPETIKLAQRKGEKSDRPFTTIAVIRCPMELGSRFLGTH